MIKTYHVVNKTKLIEVYRQGSEYTTFCLALTVRTKRCATYIFSYKLHRLQYLFFICYAYCIWRILKRNLKNPIWCITEECHVCNKIHSTSADFQCKVYMFLCEEFIGLYKDVKSWICGPKELYLFLIASLMI